MELRYDAVSHVRGKSLIRQPSVTLTLSLKKDPIQRHKHQPNGTEQNRTQAGGGGLEDKSIFTSSTFNRCLTLTTPMALAGFYVSVTIQSKGI